MTDRDETALRCGPDCPTPDAPHVEPHIYWIGDWPLAHGEDDERDVPDTGADYGGWRGFNDAYCLCGHPNYLTCPRADSEGVMSLTITKEDDR